MFLVNVLLVFEDGLLIALDAQITISLLCAPIPITGQIFSVLLIGAILGCRPGMFSAYVILLKARVGYPYSRVALVVSHGYWGLGEDISLDLSLPRRWLAC